MKKIALVAAGIVVVLGGAGCSGSSNDVYYQNGYKAGKSYQMQGAFQQAELLGSITQVQYCRQIGSQGMDNVGQGTTTGSVASWVQGCASALHG